MNCDLCSYRVRLPGFEERVGTPLSLAPPERAPRGWRARRAANQAAAEAGAAAASVPRRGLGRRSGGAGAAPPGGPRGGGGRADPPLARRHRGAGRRRPRGRRGRAGGASWAPTGRASRRWRSTWWARSAAPTAAWPRGRCGWRASRWLPRRRWPRCGGGSGWCSRTRTTRSCCPPWRPTSASPRRTGGSRPRRWRPGWRPPSTWSAWPTRPSGRPQHLSLGERRRVALAGVLAAHPEVLVLDEPTANLDPAARRDLVEVVRGLELTTIVVTHDLPLALELCPRSVVLAHGRVAADGPDRGAVRQPVACWPPTAWSCPTG